MKSIKANVLYKELSETLGYNEEHIKLIVEGYYNVIAKSISNLDAERIRISKIGELSASLRKTQKRIAEQERKKEAKTEFKTMRDYAILKSIEAQLEKLYKIRKIKEEQMQLKKIKHKERIDYERNKDMERKG